MIALTSRFANVWPGIEQICVIFKYLEVVDHCSETQLQEGENLSYLI